MTPAPGATHADLLALLTELADVLDLPALGGLADTLGNLADHVLTRDVLTVQEHRVELGLCPDGGSHLTEYCLDNWCPTWAAANTGVQSSPVDSLGRTS